MKENDIFEFNGRKYVLVPAEAGCATECEHCDLYDFCDPGEGCICKKNFGDEYSSGKRFMEIRQDALTEEKVYDYYQERSETAGSRADQLAWVFIIMMAGGLVSGHTFKTFSVCAALSAAYLLFSVMQAVWQTFTSWLFMRRIRKADTVPDDYPSWVKGGSWLFFWLKTAAISAAALYFIRAVFM